MEKDVINITNYLKNIIKSIKKYLINIICVLSSVVLSFGICYMIIVGIMLITDEITSDEKIVAGSIIIIFCVFVFLCCSFCFFKRCCTKRFIFAYVIPSIITYVITYLWACGTIQLGIT